MPRNKYPEETIQKILDASLKLFCEKGYEETTVLDIIEHMGGMTRGAFYHHFKSKEEVLDALLDRLFEENNPFVEVRKRSDLTGLEKLRAAILSTNAEETDRKTLNLALLPLLASPTLLKILVIDTNRDALPPLLQPLIEEGIGDGSIHVADAKLASELLANLINFWMIPSIYHADEAEQRRKLLMIKAALDGIGLPLLDDAFLADIREHS